MPPRTDPLELRISPAHRHLATALACAVALVAAVLLVPEAAPAREGSYRASVTGDEGASPLGTVAATGDDTSPVARMARAARTARLAADGHAHDHSNPATKNSISRAGDVAGAVDPTTADEAAANTAYVARDRQGPTPPLTTVDPTRERTPVPADRYAMANGCYTLQAPDGRYLRRAADGGLAATAERRAAAEPFRFRATDLGEYLLYGTAEDFAAVARRGLVKDLLGTLGLGAGQRPVHLATKPSPRAEWTVRGKDGQFRFTAASGQGLALAGNGTAVAGAPVDLRLRAARGCATYPQVQVNIDGDPHAGATAYQGVRGYIDPHVHGMAFEFLGGKVHCGRPWHEYGAPYALTDCLDHRLTGGKGAVLEAILSGEPTHDPVGWPTFADWPAPNSLTHEGVYYKWLERAWRGGLRVYTNLLVENGQLCRIYPLKENSCDEMTSVKLQAKRMYQLQDYIDAQYGGPGRGWYRIVTSPREARRVINSGRLAVVMGIETSVPFGCSYEKLPVVGDVPACDREAIERQLDEMYRLGVRQMELVNKFDNALAGVAGDSGAVGVAVNAANFLETGSFWQMRHCEPADGESHDRTQLAFPDISAGQQDALFGAIAKLGTELNLPTLPLYPTAPHCNLRGLTDLGSFLLAEMMDRHMLIDPDHMSVKARRTTLTQLERAGYSGVISTHSWSTPDAYPRIYALGGFVAPYAGDAAGFVTKWRRHLGWADEDYFFGFGYGSDINGLGAQGDPRGADVENPVTYPFTGMNGVTVHQQVSGERVYDINVDGVAHYGLYPDWIQDLRMIGGAEHGEDIVTDLRRGPEAYLQTWERAYGIAPDPCRNPELRQQAGQFRRIVRGSVQRGEDTWEVMQRLGQPYSRIGRTFTYCAEQGGREVRFEVVFDGAGTAVDLRRA